jgi:hypothetical protein
MVEEKERVSDQKQKTMTPQYRTLSLRHLPILSSQGNFINSKKDGVLRGAKQSEAGKEKD